MIASFIFVVIAAVVVTPVLSLIIIIDIAVIVNIVSGIPLAVDIGLVIIAAGLAGRLLVTLATLACLTLARQVCLGFKQSHGQVLLFQLEIQVNRVS